MGQLYVDLWIHEVLTTFVILFAIVTIIMGPRQLLGLLSHYLVKRNRLFMCHDIPQGKSVTVFTPIYQEDPEVLHDALSGLRRSLMKHCSQFAIICVVDAADAEDQDEVRNLSEIAASYGAHVFHTNARSKRKNLRNALHWAKEVGVLYEFSAFHDSDSVPTTPNDDIIGELLRPFADPAIGGVTTAQRLRNADTNWLTKILDWLEDARIGSSMAAGSLFGQVGCLPGRLYMVRTEYIENWMDDLVEEYWTVPVYSWKWPFISIQKVQAHAGDDRRMTLRIQECGAKTVMNPRAKVETLMQDKLSQINRVFRRWATSSQWLTLIATYKYPWFRRQWFVMFQYYGDMLITFITVYLMLRWSFLMIWGEGSVLIPLYQLLAYSLVGVWFTFLIRQLWHVVRHPKQIWLLPTFIVMVTFWQFIRLWALFTPHKISQWGSRKGADDKKKAEVWFVPYNAD